MDDATSTELPRIRRAALGMSLVAGVLISSGVTIDRAAAIPLFGLRVTLERADLIPLAVVISALYCAARYWYYGHMISRSPYRVRRELLNMLVTGDGGPAWSYFGPGKVKSRYPDTDLRKVSEATRAIGTKWPRFLRATAAAEWERTEVITVHGSENAGRIDALVPMRCRIAALCEDLDYATPVIAPLAVAAWYWWP
ncbi:MAG: hypothetical protein V9E87_03255 [Gemmatimonadales bacterium]